MPDKLLVVAVLPVPLDLSYVESLPLLSLVADL